MATAPLKLRDRIVELKRVPASSLVPHDSNWRVHGEAQRAAMKGILADVGFAGVVLTRKLPGGKLQIIDGHLRGELAGKGKIPVIVTDLTDDEAKKLLLTYDPVGAMAEANHQALKELLASVATQDPGLQSLLDSLAGIADLASSVDGFVKAAGEAGEGPESDGWPIVALKVPPTTKGRFDAAMAVEEGEAWERFDRLLTKAGCP